MGFAYGNNTQNSGPSFHHRRFYERKIMPINFEEPSLNSFDTYIDIFINKPFYGRIDDTSSSVFSAKNINTRGFTDKFTVPLDEKAYLKKFKNTNLYAMNFVVDAFEDMALFFNRSCQTLNDLSKVGPYSSMSAKVAWSSPIERYFTFVEGIYNIYKNHMLNLHPEDLNSIKNFDDFYNLFMPFLITNTESFSIVFSSFIMSKHISPGCSGLMVEIAIDDHSDDLIKTSEYISDRNYSFFKNAALRYGFYLDRNTPWRLFANVSSSNMLPYMKKYNLEAVKDVFSKQFIKSYKYDLFFLRRALYNCYIMFLKDFPNYKNKEIINCEDIVKEYKREQIPYDRIQKIYTDKKFISDYITLRARSVRVDTTDNSYIKIKQNFINSLKVDNIDNILSKINNKFNTYKNVLLDKNYFTLKNSDVINTSEPTE